MDTHGLSSRAYLLAYIALLVLLGVSVGIGHIDIGWANMFAAIFIAAIQGCVIALIMMHGLFEKVFIKLTMCAALLWFLILITLTMTDYITRNWVPVAGK